jgi:predicted MFS family arabinose efflux permease
VFSGICGSLTGVLTNRFGTAHVHGCALFGISISTLGVTATAFSPVFAFATMGLFGAAYIVATGVFLIQGIKLMPDRPDLGLGIPFLSLALGQAIGTPLFGAAMNAIGTLGALAMFAAAACVAIFFKPRRKGVVLN